MHLLTLAILLALFVAINCFNAGLHGVRASLRERTCRSNIVSVVRMIEGYNAQTFDKSRSSMDVSQGQPLAHDRTVLDASSRADWEHWRLLFSTPPVADHAYRFERNILVSFS